MTPEQQQSIVKTLQEPLKVNVKQGQDNISEHQKWLNEQRAKRMAQ